MNYFYVSIYILKKCVYREKISSNSENLIALILIIFLTHKTKTKKIKKSKTYLNETMAEKQERQKCMS